MNPAPGSSSHSASLARTIDGDALAVNARMKTACLCQSCHVSVCDLNGTERFIAWAVRWRVSSHDSDAFAADCLADSFERAGLAQLQPAFERFIALVSRMPRTHGAAQRLGCWRLNPLEASVLHAIACLQGGLIGDAWKAVAALCRPQDAGRALESLDELAQALLAEGARCERWRVDEACRPALQA